MEGRWEGTVLIRHHNPMTPNRLGTPQGTRPELSAAWVTAASPNFNSLQGPVSLQQPLVVHKCEGT